MKILSHQSQNCGMWVLESSSATIDHQRKVVALLQSRQGEEREEREKLEAQLSELQQNPAPAIDLPSPADLLNQLKAERRKSTATLSDIEAILEMIEKSCDDTSQEI
jgi:ribosomal protein S4